MVLSAGNCPSRNGRAVKTNADVVRIAIRVCFLTGIASHRIIAGNYTGRRFGMLIHL
jgi:hypothetical protein